MANSKLETDNPILVKILEGLARDSGTSITKSEKKHRNEVYIADPNITEADLDEYERGQSPLVKSILNVLNGGQKEGVERLAFTNNPTQVNQYKGLWKTKLRLVPDTLLKRIAIQDDLVASILQARSAHLSAFGRPPRDRFSTGFVIETKPGVDERLSPEEKEDLQNGMVAATTRLITCGATRGYSDPEKM